MWLKRIRQFIYEKVNFKAFFKVLLNILVFCLIFIVIVPVGLIFRLNSFYNDKIFTNIDELPKTRVAIVFGAGLSQNGTEPSGILYDRIMSAVELYKAGVVKKILMSGDNRFKDYNEPQVMIKIAKENGVSIFDLQADYAGRRTYDTCYRAKTIFGIDKAILITQDYHLTRALYTCNVLGIDSVGYSADKNSYSDINLFAMRDFFAIIKAYWDLYVDPPEVVLGEKINF